MSQDDIQAIKAAALDYIEGYFEGDAKRMRRALSPHLRKCTIIRDSASGKITIDAGRTTPEGLVRDTANGLMKEEGVDVSAEVLYVFRDIAVARTSCPYFEDLLHLANFGEYGWRIVNAIWQLKEGEFEPSLEEQMEFWSSPT